MSWTIHDEFIDLSQARHVVVFKNRDTGTEHHLINLFGLKACPTCGTVKASEPVDFEKLKSDTLATLNAHHRTMLQYREKHSRVRLGTEPK
jgi:hypothetical protein